MRGHNPNDVLKVHTPIIELLSANPTEVLVEAVAKSLAARTAATLDVRAQAQEFLRAVRENIRVAGKVTFVEYYNVDGDYPGCIVELAHGDTSIRLWGRVNLHSDTASLMTLIERPHGATLH